MSSIKQRAAAETDAILRAQHMERVGAEIDAMKAIRFKRLLKTTRATLLKMVAIAVLSGTVCAVIGFMAGKALPPAPQIQVHVIQREEPLATAGKEASGLTVQQAVPVATPAIASNIQPPVNTPVAATTSPQAQQQQLASLSNVPVPVRMPLNAIRLPKQPVAQPAISKKQAQSQTVEPTNLEEAEKTKKPVETAAADEFVLAKKAGNLSSPTTAKKADDVPAVGNSTYKVVNILDGALMIRQGQQVKQIRVGEKMPDGQTLKTVDSDKGKFETQP